LDLLVGYKQRDCPGNGLGSVLAEGEVVRRRAVFKIALCLFGVDPGTSSCGFPVLDPVVGPAEVLSAVAPTVQLIVGVFAFRRVAYKDGDRACSFAVKSSSNLAQKSRLESYVYDNKRLRVGGAAGVEPASEIAVSQESSCFVRFLLVRPRNSERTRCAELVDDLAATTRTEKQPPAHCMTSAHSPQVKPWKTAAYLIKLQVPDYRWQL